MKRRILLFSAIAGIFSLTLSSYHDGMKNISTHGGICPQNITGSPYAGGYNPTGCGGNGVSIPGFSGGCHNSNTTGYSVSPVILTDPTDGSLVTDGYIPGKTYKVTIIGQYSPTATLPSLPKFGFQCGIVGWNAGATVDPQPAGSVNPATSSAANALDTIQSISGAFIVEQKRDIDAVSGSGGALLDTISFKWVAPDTTTHMTNVGFYVVMLGGQASGMQADSVAGNSISTVVPKSTVAVIDVFKNVSFSTYPNPVSSDLHLSMNNMQTGSYTINAYDMMGRRILSQGIMVNGSSYTYDMNTAAWTSGVYQLQIMRGNAQHTISVVKQ